MSRCVALIAHFRENKSGCQNEFTIWGNTRTVLQNVLFFCVRFFKSLFSKLSYLLTYLLNPEFIFQLLRFVLVAGVGSRRPLLLIEIYLISRQLFCGSMPPRLQTFMSALTQCMAAYLTYFIWSHMTGFNVHCNWHNLCTNSA